MVNCRYTVTADIYEDLIELQIRLKNRTPSQQLKFWGLNVGFLIAAILFLLLERDYSIVPAPSVYGGTESALPLWDPDEKRIRLCHTEYYPAEKLCCTGG